jgi:hypothetical protein
MRWSVPTSIWSVCQNSPVNLESLSEMIGARESMEVVDVVVVKTSDLFGGDSLRGRNEGHILEKVSDKDENCTELLTGIVGRGR